jgi:hypothetical protein
MKKCVFLFLLSFLLISNKSSAQASLGISQYAYTIYNDTAVANSYDSVSIYIVNRSTTNFSDFFQVVASVQDTGSTSYYRVDTTSSAFSTFIAAGDSIPFKFRPYYVVDTNEYHYDINVIVIWPVAGSASIDDSLFFNVVVVLPQTIEEIDLSHIINAYPNPTTDNITLENTGKNSIEEVRIYDTQGRLIDALNKPEFICTEAWAPGMYMINIQLKDGKTQTIRVVKQ